MKLNQDPQINFTSIDNAFSNCIKQFIGWLNATMQQALWENIPVLKSANCPTALVGGKSKSSNSQETRLCAASLEKLISTPREHAHGSQKRQ